MNNKCRLLSAVVMTACGALSTQVQATLPSNAIMQFTNSTSGCLLGGTYPDSCTYGIKTVISGSYFTMDQANIGTIDPGERIPVTRMTAGVTLGVTQPASGSHSGAITGAESPGIDIWEFFGGTGMHQTTTSITKLSDDGAGNATLDFSGWNVTWNGIASIPMGGTDTANFPTDTHIAEMTCYTTYADDGVWSTLDFSGVTDCVNGAYFVVDHDSVHVPNGDPSGFGGVGYTVHLEGTITLPPNTLPIASDTSISALPATSHSWTPSASDDDSGDTLTCSIVTQGASGTAAVAPGVGNCSTAGTYTPTAGAGFSGTDSFTYKVNDTRDDSATNGTVSVSIDADPAPVCPNFAATANSGEANSIALNITNCTDAGGTAVVPTSVAVTTPSTKNGTVSVVTATQIATYTPAAGFSGTDTFTYTVSDSAAASSAATVTVTVAAKNVPVISDGTFSAGTTAVSAGSTNGIVTAAEIGVTDSGSSAQQGIAQACIGGCFDFQITGFTGDAQVVLPLSTAIPAPATGNSIVYRKLKSSGWVTFDTSGNDAIDTAPGTVSGSDILCPGATDPSYATSPGLTTGHRCVRLTIVDNGPNDNDATVGTVADPSGIAETTIIDTRVASTDGCSMSATPVALRDRADWLIVAGFIGFIALFRLRRKKV